MSVSWKSISQVAKIWSNLGRNIKKNEDYLTKITLAMLLANLFVYTIKSDITFNHQTKDLAGVTADLEGLRADLVDDIMLAALDRSLSDTTADRKQLIKRDMLLLIKKHSDGLPYMEQRPVAQEVVVEVDEEVEELPFPADGGRIV